MTKKRPHSKDQITKQNIQKIHWPNCVLFFFILIFERWLLEDQP